MINLKGRDCYINNTERKRCICMIHHVLHASACIYSLLGVMAGFVGIYSLELINAKSDIASWITNRMPLFELQILSFAMMLNFVNTCTSPGESSIGIMVLWYAAFDELLTCFQSWSKSISKLFDNFFRYWIFIEHEERNNYKNTYIQECKYYNQNTIKLKIIKYHKISKSLQFNIVYALIN